MGGIQISCRLGFEIRIGKKAKCHDQNVPENLFEISDKSVFLGDFLVFQKQADNQKCPCGKDIGIKVKDRGRQGHRMNKKPLGKVSQTVGKTTKNQKNQSSLLDFSFDRGVIRAHEQDCHNQKA